MQIAKLFYKTSMGILWDKNEKRKKKNVKEKMN